MLPRSTAYTTSARWTGFALGLAIFAVLAISPSFFLFGAGVWAIGAAARIAPRPLMRSKWLALATWLVVMTIIRLVTHGEVILRQPLAGAIDDYELSFESGERLRGRFLVARLDYAGDYNGERNYTLNLESSGAVASL